MSFLDYMKRSLGTDFLFPLFIIKDTESDPFKSQEDSSCKGENIIWTFNRFIAGLVQNFVSLGARKAFSFGFTVRTT